MPRYELNPMTETAIPDAPNTGLHGVWDTHGRRFLDADYFPADAAGRKAGLARVAELNDEFEKSCAVEKPVPERCKILMEGAALTNGDRDKSYGPPILNLGAAGRFKKLAREISIRELGPAEAEAIDQCLTKIARILTGRAIKRDNYLDLATYAAIAGECAELEMGDERDQ